MAIVLRIVAALLLVSVCHGSTPCQVYQTSNDFLNVHCGDAVYNLSCLARMPVVEVSSQPYDFLFSLQYGALNSQSTGCNLSPTEGDTGIIQRAHGSCYSLGLLTQKSFIDINGNLQLTLAGGSVCGAEQMRHAVITFICDEAVLEPMLAYQGEPQACVYAFTIRHAEACRGANPPCAGIASTTVIPTSSTTPRPLDDVLAYSPCISRSTDLVPVAPPHQPVLDTSFTSRATRPRPLCC